MQTQCLLSYPLFRQLKELKQLQELKPNANVVLAIIINKTNVPADLQSAGIKYQELRSAKNTAVPNANIVGSYSS